MFSRTFAAKNAQTARRAAWTAAPLLVFFGVIVTMLALLNIKAEQPISDWLAVGSPLPAAAAAALSMGLISALAGSADTILLSAAGIIEKDLFGGAVHAPCVSGLQPSAFWPHWPLIPRETSSVGSSKATRSSSRALPCRSSSSSPAARRHADPKLWTIGAAAGGLGGLSAALPASPSGLTAASLLPPFCGLCRTARRQTRRTAAASPLQPLS